jgi:integrase
MKRDRQLPAGMYLKHGAYWLVRRNKWTRLGTDLGASLRAYASHVETKPVGMCAAVDRAIEDISGRGKPNTVRQYKQAAKKLRNMFAEFHPSQVRPIHVRQMLTHLKATPNMANRCRSVLMLAMKLAVESGECETNPVAEIDPLPERQRERYLSDAEFAAIYDAAPDIVQVFMAIAYMTGQRIGDVLAIRISDLGEDGIAFRQEKTEARLIVAWTPELRQAAQRAKDLRTVRSFFLISQRNGRRYSYKGMRDAFDRARIAAGVEDATPHDIRAKAGTDAKRQGKNPTLLLGHTSPQHTGRYIRQRLPELVEGPTMKRGAK